MCSMWAYIHIYTYIYIYIYIYICMYAYMYIEPRVVGKPRNAAKFDPFNRFLVFVGSNIADVNNLPFCALNQAKKKCKSGLKS